MSKFVTSGPVRFSEVKGLLRLDADWWIDTGLIGAAFKLPSYDPDDMRPIAWQSATGRLQVREGYIWDGSSRPLVRSQEDWDAAPSLVHDVREEAFRAGKLTRADMAQGDALYRDLLAERNVSPVRAGFRWFILRARRFLRLDGRNKGPEYPHRRAA